MLHNRLNWAATIALLACAPFALGQPPAPRPPAAPMALDTPSVKTAPPTTPQPPDLVLDTPSVDPPSDKSALGSPVPSQRLGPTLPIGTSLRVQIASTVSSGVQRNGDTVKAVLAAPVQTSTGAALPRGTPVEATVVSAARAGTASSGGILSLQLTRVGAVPIVTDVVDFNGQEGHKDVADSAPGKGMEAIVQSGALVQFQVLENGSATGLAPAGTGAAAASGATVNSLGGSGSRTPAMASPTNTPNNAPGANQRSIPGTTQPINPPSSPPKP